MACILLVTLTALSASVLADVVRLRDGAEVTGEILKRTDSHVWIDIGSQVIEIPVEDVAEAIVDASDSEVAVEDHGFLYRVATGLPELSPREQAALVGPSVIKVSTPKALGSGVILNEDGFAVTNAHVIQGETDLRATVWLPQPDGTLRRTTLEDIEIVAINNHLDLALLRLVHPEDKPFDHAPLERDESIQVGQTVFAIGNPLGLEQTMSQGVISTTQRSFNGLTYIQTDAAVNPGNSGGPLFNTWGEVVGITNMVRRDAEALNFAIPTRYVKDFIRNREAFTYDAKNPNAGHKYLEPPSRKRTGTAPQLKGS